MLSAPLALGNYINNNNTLQVKSNGHTDDYSCIGGDAQDRYYYLKISATTTKKLLTYSGTSWFNYLDGSSTSGYWTDVQKFYYDM